MEGDVEELVAIADIERFDLEKGGDVIREDGGEEVCETMANVSAGQSRTTQPSPLATAWPPHTTLHNLEDGALGKTFQSSIRCDCEEKLYCCKNVKSLLSIKEESVNVIENISLLRKFITANEGGLNIEYRCVKCRDCTACKKADETEKLSLREEQENQLIKESVNLDFENKTIKCTLPGRGPERDFLSSNRDSAAKVLLSVCKKYHDDPSAKDLILKAFQKLFDNNFVQFVHEMTPEEKEKFNNKEVQHFIPWRPVFADSISTPCRPTFDASTRTRRRDDGSAGRCLNDYVVKGSIDSMNLLRLILRWQVGKFALTGDLAQFYNKCKLEATQWNLQKFLRLEDLDPNGKLMEAVIKTLIYGVKCVAAQSEFALEELANSIEDAFPEIALLLRLCRYVDDIGDSKTSLEDCKKITEEADEVLGSVGLNVKGWTYSSEDPPEKVSKDGISIGVAGMKWTSKLDAVEVKIPPLHFGKRVRGKLDENTVFFDGEFGDLDSFVPAKLTKRIACSKLASIFDPYGKLAPILIGLKTDLREVNRATTSWDEAMSAKLRNKWLENFWRLEKLRGLKFHRPIMPEDAVDTKLRLTTGGDAAKALSIGSWGGFKRKNGRWSCKLILGRALLAAADGTTSKDELESLTGAANLNSVVEKALDGWVDSSIVINDSMIALAWTTSENKRLSIFHRNRVIAIRRQIRMEQLYHVTTNENPTDICTRPSKVKLENVGPSSSWENGLEWMTHDLSKAIENGTLMPAQNLRLSP